MLCVTHDRFFLDRVATSILAFERDDDGTRRAVHVQGNYQRYLDYRAARARAAALAESEAKAKQAKAAEAAPTGATATANARKTPARKPLTYGEELELETLPERIEEAETEVANLEQEMAAPDFYERDHTEQATFFQRLQQAKQTADELVERWADLESRSESS